VERGKGGGGGGVWVKRYSLKTSLPLSLSGFTCLTCICQELPTHKFEGFPKWKYIHTLQSITCLWTFVSKTKIELKLDADPLPLNSQDNTHNLRKERPTPSMVAPSYKAQSCSVTRDGERSYGDLDMAYVWVCLEKGYNKYIYYIYILVWEWS